MQSRRVASFAEEGKWTSGADSTMLIGDWQAWVDGEGHWKVRGPDPDNEAHYADGDIELTEAEYIEAGNSEARRKIRARRAKEAARAYIKTMALASKRHHAAKKTPSSQLDREIAEALAQTPGMTTEQIERYRSGRKWGLPADLAFKVAAGRPLSRTPRRRSHATKSSDWPHNVKVGDEVYAVAGGRRHGPGIVEEIYNDGTLRVDFTRQFAGRKRVWPQDLIFVP